MRSKKIGRELGGRYVIEGSVRPAGDLLRVNVQLTDAESGAHLWADRFDTDHADLVKAQNEILGRLARTLNLKLMQAAGLCIEWETALAADPQDLLIYGWAMYQRATTASALQQARRILERVLEIDPGSTGAKIGIG